MEHFKDIFIDTFAYNLFWWFLRHMLAARKSSMLRSHWRGVIRTPLIIHDSVYKAHIALHIWFNNSFSFVQVNFFTFYTSRTRVTHTDVSGGAALLSGFALISPSVIFHSIFIFPEQQKHGGAKVNRNVRGRVRAVRRCTCACLYRGE